MNPLFKQKPVRELLRAVQVLASKRKTAVFIVGGSVRDFITGREKANPDIDFAVPSGAVEFSRRLAAALKAGFVALDERHGTGRVVHRLPDGRGITLDFSDFKGVDIAEDLFHRDFTVNAMAVPLEAMLSGKPFREILCDPWGGRKDIGLGIVRMVNPGAFDEDPLRILRCFSTAAILGAGMEKATLRRLREKKAQLSGVSSERVRDELFKIFSSAACSRIITALDEHGVWDIVFPELVPMKRLRQGAYHHLDVWGHTLETLGRLERVGLRLMRLEQVGAYLGEEISSGRSRWQLLKLAAVLHDAGKPSTFRVHKGKVQFHGHDREGARIAAAIAQRLRLSKEEERFLRRIVALHLRPGFLATQPKVTPKAAFRFFRDAGQEAGSVLILSLADLRATRGYKLVEESRSRHERLIKRLLRDYFQRQECPPPARLVNGHDLISLGLEPSPLFGRILRQLEELQAEGTITSKEQGLKQAAALAQKAARRRSP